MQTAPSNTSSEFTACQSASLFLASPSTSTDGSPWSLAVGCSSLAPVIAAFSFAGTVASSSSTFLAASIRQAVILPTGFPSSTTAYQAATHPPQFSMSRASSNKAATPNHALQRTAPRVTVAAISSSNPSRPSVALSYARCLFLRPTSQLPRHAPPSLSLGSLGD